MLYTDVLSPIQGLLQQEIQKNSLIPEIALVLLGGLFALCKRNYLFDNVFDELL